jgi:hypothetical protein
MLADNPTPQSVAGGALPTVTYCAPRAQKAPVVHGSLSEGLWAEAPKTSRFADAASGSVAFFDTHAALAWDDEHLYVGAWLEERDVWTTGERRRGLAWQENTFELFIGADGAHYQLSVNAAGKTEELLFVWKDAWTRGGRYDTSDLDLARQAPGVIGGDAAPRHRRGQRWMFDEWRMENLRVAVRVDGDLNERHDLDRGWTVEMALPWEGLRHVVDGGVPPRAGQRLRIALGRNQVIDQRATRWTTTWSWHVAGEAGLYAPEHYPVVELA